MVVSLNDNVNPNQPGVEFLKAELAVFIGQVFLGHPDPGRLLKPREVNGSIDHGVAAVVHDAAGEGGRVVRGRQGKSVDKFVRTDQTVVG